MHRSRRRSLSVSSTSGEHDAAYHSRIRGGSVGSRADRPYICGRSESAAVITDVQPMIVQGPLCGPRWPRFPDLDELGRGEAKISRRASHQPTFPNILFWGLSWWFFFKGCPRSCGLAFHTFPVAVEYFSPEIMRMIFEEKMPSLAML